MGTLAQSQHNVCYTWDPKSGVSVYERPADKTLQFSGAKHVGVSTGYDLWEYPDSSVLAVGNEDAEVLPYGFT